MLDLDALEQVEGDADLIFAMARDADPLDPPAIADLCAMVTGFQPEYSRMVGKRGTVYRKGDRWRVAITPGLPPAIARETCAHEIAEWYFKTTGYAGADIEERCDAIGARLLCPRPAFAASLRRVGHRIHELARRYGTTQALAFLRTGEVTGRAVFLPRAADPPIVRGAPFAWPAMPLRKVLRERPPGVHPVRLDGSRMGLIASLAG